MKHFPNHIPSLYSCLSSESHSTCFPAQRAGLLLLAQWVIHRSLLQDSNIYSSYTWKCQSALHVDFLSGGRQTASKIKESPPLFSEIGWFYYIWADKLCSLAWEREPGFRFTNSYSPFFWNILYPVLYVSTQLLWKVNEWMANIPNSLLFLESIHKLVCWVLRGRSCAKWVRFRAECCNIGGYGSKSGANLRVTVILFSSLVTVAGKDWITCKDMAISIQVSPAALCLEDASSRSNPALLLTWPAWFSVLIHGFLSCDAKINKDLPSLVFASFARHWGLPFFATFFSFLIRFLMQKDSSLHWGSDRPTA